VRILIGNHIDPAIRDRGDLWAWTQRLLWFARDDDLIVLCAAPDQRFLRYATSLTDVNRLRVLLAPAGRHGGRLLDPDSLADPTFLRAVRDVLGGDLAQVDEVFALWPSAAVSRFAATLGLADRYPGADFFAQGGGELANSKAVFRALAAGAGVPICTGRVCRSPAEAIAATNALLDRTGAVMVKQAHNGAGVGNQLLLRDTDLASDHVGARHLHRLGGAAEPAVAYWAQRWDWASACGRYPVVVEEFAADAVSVYSEHHATATATRATQTGMLCYVGRRLSHQIVPLRGIDDEVRERLLDGGTRLAEAYRALGYRGYLSADAIITADGQVVFTEVNAQVSGSLHIYQVIAQRIVDIAAAPQRSVVEYHVPPTWAVADLDTFLRALHELGCGYDPATRTGVIVSMPVVALEAGCAQFVFCLAYGGDAERQAIWERLDQRFSVVPAGAYRADEHVGVPHPSTEPRRTRRRGSNRIVEGTPR
jgi:Pre ATP-grasp domain